MPGFDVDVASVAALGSLMRRNAEAAGVFVHHLEIRRPDKVEEGLLGLLNGPLNRLQDLGEANTRRGHELGLGAGTELRKAAEFYGSVDRTKATYLDMMYPGAAPTRLSRHEVVGPDARFDEGRDPGADPANPDKPYNGPPTHPTPEDVATGGWPLRIEDEIDKLTGQCSVARHVRDLVTAISGKDIFSILLSFVSGDWGDLYRQGKVFEDTAFAFTVIKDNVDRGRYLVQDKWEGNAANAAEDWIAAYAKACAAHAEFMAEVGGQIRKFASTAYHALQALNIGLDFLIDTLVDLLLRGYGGPFVGGAISILRGENPLHAVVSVMLAVSRISDVIDALRAAAHVVVGAIEQVVANGEVVAKAWPSLGYDHPAVT
ncbi:hypothetical protein [Saccharothrix hoggarensis]|uniref:Excreted virulence factor EspC (Type VII ESX diderm) n=1 Tax=Saccharothrix hoggarensis TaxID=913853 RepID=A0ABW3R0L9_9PSEU